jgi:hypothetical protein
MLWLVIFSGTEILYLVKQLVMKNCKEASMRGKKGTQKCNGREWSRFLGRSRLSKDRRPLLKEPVGKRMWGIWTGFV